jgi:hypothetical protein
MSGIKGGKDTGTGIERAGIGSAMTAMTIEKGPMVGSGPASIDSTTVAG